MPSFDKVRRMGKKAFLNTANAPEVEAVKEPDDEDEREPTNETSKAAEVLRAQARDDEAAPKVGGDSKEKMRPAVGRPASAGQVKAESKPKPATEPGPSGSRHHAAQTPDPVESGTTLKLKARVRFPAEGHSKLFDQATAAYGEKEALQFILKAALAAYDKALRSGKISEPLPNYPTGQGSVQVSRAFSMEAFERAKAMLDPLGMVPAGTLAAKICRNALAYHFKDT
ncbi:VirC2 family conjugal transfer protein [Hoeflea sp.]|uniref:VirC2 family conjugal transfer protein n=1 Tax=Hoeflea sp. TaxID=1940281 RepID=UPI0019BA20ED|nr:VirC2 family conjugal transfer protein [Hoeflea sp.]MBC7284709.1 VirC2 family conjugal transfer protein [Hoeflea sp.]